MDTCAKGAGLCSIAKGADLPRSLPRSALAGLGGILRRLFAKGIHFVKCSEQPIARTLRVCGRGR